MYQWHLKHKELLDERSEYHNEKDYSPYKHRNIRGRGCSFKYRKNKKSNERVIKELKQKLSVHNGLTKKYKIMFIKDFLIKRVGNN